MFIIDEDGTTLKVTRGQSGSITFGALTPEGEPYTFVAGDVVRLNVTKEGKENMVVMSVDTIVEEDTEEVTISITSFDSKIGTVINKPTDYWYDIELNPDSSLAQMLSIAQMLLGYDDEGPKIFKLYPESIKEDA